MRLADLLRAAVREARAHPARSLMTALSLAMGTAAMLYTLAAAGDGLRSYHEAMTLAGPGRLFIGPKENYVSSGLSQGLTWDDAIAVRRHWPDLYMVYPLQSMWGGRLRWGNFHSRNLRIMGTTEEWRKRDWVYEMRGRFLNARDVAEAARVCVLIQPRGFLRKHFWSRYYHQSRWANLLERNDLLGRRILLNDHLFTVVGILREPYKEKDPRWIHYGGGDGVVIVPISTLQTVLVGSRSPSQRVDQLAVDTGDARTAAAALRRIGALLAERHQHEPDVDLKDFRQIALGAMKELRDSLIGVLLIGIVALLAGGIGIMNVTLATIFSRVREIGIRRALGGTRRDIVAQFTVEALLLGAIGGAAGCLLGLGTVLWLPPNEDRLVLPTVAHYAAALALALGTSLAFAFFPALKASRYDPVEALRYE